MNDLIHIAAVLFLMLGPFKLLAPYNKITAGADPQLTKKIATRSILFSTITLLVAGLLGNAILTRYGIPLPILAFSGGIILFLVALLNIIHQFDPIEEEAENEIEPTMKMAIYPIAFPTIVTPYGIAAVIVFLGLNPDIKSQINIGLLVLGIMLINLIFMIFNKGIFKIFAVLLPILGAILSVIQVALGVLIIYKSIAELMKLF